MGKCASLRLRCVMGNLSVGISLTKRTAGNKQRAVSTAVLMQNAASQRNSSVMENKTAWMAQMKWTAVSPQFFKVVSVLKAGM